MVYQTVIEFRHVDFDKGWNRALLATERVVEYTPLEDRAQLQVVTEGATGTAITYFFEVPREEKFGYQFLKTLYSYLLNA